MGEAKFINKQKRQFLYTNRINYDAMGEAGDGWH